MRNRFKKAFDKVSLDNMEKNQIIENVVNNQSIMKEKRNFWQGKYGGIATVCAALIVFVLVNAAIFGGMKKGSPASDIPESETTESMSPEEPNVENAAIVAGEELTTAEETPTGENVTAAVDESTEKDITEEPELKAAEGLQIELENILAQTESLSPLDVPGETQKRLFELLADYLPVKNAVMTANMAVRGQNMYEHSGIDMKSDDTTVYTVMNGTVLDYGFTAAKGNYLVIDNGNGVMTEYYHLKENFVSAGDVLSAGTPVAVMGSTGMSTGPHLHWQMTVNGELVNPLCYAAEHLELFHRD